MKDMGSRDDRWYLKLMAPNTRGPKFAWLGPTSIYINGAALYRPASSVMLGSRRHDECNRQTLSSFTGYRPEMAFPQAD